MTSRSAVAAAWAVSGMALLALGACTSGESDAGPTTSQSQSSTRGETVDIEGGLRMQVPDGWTALTDDIPGLDLYLVMVVPEGTEPAELEPESGPPDVAYLTVMDLGPTTNGAERYAAAAMEKDAENADSYSDVAALDPVAVGSTTFYGYEGVLEKGGTEVPFQYWHADADGTTYKVAVHADPDGAFPRALEEAWESMEFSS